MCLFDFVGQRYGGAYLHIAADDGGAGGVDRAAVTEMVVSHHKKAALGKIARKTVIALDIFRHAVGQLQYGHGRLGIVRPLDGVQMGAAIGGGEGEVRHIYHSQAILSVL